MTVTGSILLRTLSLLILIIFFLVGVFSYKDSKRTIDKYRFGFLAVGSLICFIFAINVGV